MARAWKGDAAGTGRAKTKVRGLVAPKGKKRTDGQATPDVAPAKKALKPRKRSKLFREGEPYWAVVRTKSGRENYARLNLVRQGFEVYYPRCCPRGVGKLEPVFRTYIFVKIIDQWVTIENTFGVTGIIKTFERPTKVHPAVIKNFKRLENKEGVIEFESQRSLVPGEEIVVTRGGFKGQLMIYDGSTAEGRVKALYDFLGSRLTVEFNRHYVAPTNALHAPPSGDTPVSADAVASPKTSKSKRRAPANKSSSNTTST